MRLALSLVIVFVIGASVALFHRDPTVRKLSDGTIVKLEAVSFGKSHQFTYGSRWKPWARDHMPLIGRWIKPGPQYSSGSSSSEESLQMSFTFRDPRSGRFLKQEWHHVQAVDEHGCIFGSRDGGSGTSHDFHVSNVRFRAFPRRAAEFKVRCYLKGEAKPVEFTVRNPVKGPFPTWTPEAFPLSRTQDNIRITLAGLRLDRQTNGAALPNSEFVIEKNGQLETAWEKRYAEYQDATGNSGDSLCTNEPAWKVKAMFCRSCDATFLPDEVWSLTNFTLPGPGAVIDVNRTSTWAGATVAVRAVAGPGSYVISNGVIVSAKPLRTGEKEHGASSMNSDGNRTLKITTHHPLLLFDRTVPPPLDLMVRCRDKAGGVALAHWKLGQPDLKLYAFDPSSNATSASIDFIIQTPHHVEYMVKPPTQIRR